MTLLTSRSALGAVAPPFATSCASSDSDPSRSFRLIYAGYAERCRRLGGPESASDHLSSGRGRTGHGRQAEKRERKYGTVDRIGARSRRKSSYFISAFADATQTSKGNLSDAITSVIHPLLPPLSRPLPPISSLVFFNAPGTSSESTEEQALRREMGIRIERELASDAEDARKRQRMEEPEVHASVTTTTSTVTVQSTSVSPPSALPVATPTFGSAPVASEQIPASTSATLPSEAAVQVEHAHPDITIGHGSLSVQAVPPPVVLPPDVTTASVHVPVAGASAAAQAMEEDDDFEMPEINLESDTDEDEE